MANVRTLLDVDGSIETATQERDVSVVDERKIDQVESELSRYQVVVTACWRRSGLEVRRIYDTVV